MTLEYLFITTTSSDFMLNSILPRLRVVENRSTPDDGETCKLRIAD